MFLSRACRLLALGFASAFAWPRWVFRAMAHPGAARPAAVLIARAWWISPEL